MHLISNACATLLLYSSLYHLLSDCPPNAVCLNPNLACIVNGPSPCNTMSVTLKLATAAAHINSHDNWFYLLFIIIRCNKWCIYCTFTKLAMLPCKWLYPAGSWGNLLEGWMTAACIIFWCPVSQWSSQVSLEPLLWLVKVALDTPPCSQYWCLSMLLLFLDIICNRIII